MEGIRQEHCFPLSVALPVDLTVDLLEFLALSIDLMVDLLEFPAVPLDKRKQEQCFS